VKVGYDAISDGEHEKRSQSVDMEKGRGSRWMGKHDGIEGGVYEKTESR